MQTLLVDGYISRSFSSRMAEEYFFHLLKRNHIPTYRVVSYAGTEGCYFVLDSAPPREQVRPLPESNWVLDRSMVAMGTVVPQAMWSPPSVEDKRWLVGEAELQIPIFFEGPDGKLGIPLEAAASGQCDGLTNAHEIARVGQRSMLNVRILVCTASQSLTWKVAHGICLKYEHEVGRIQVVQVPGSNSGRSEGPPAGHHREVCAPHWTICRRLSQGRNLQSPPCRTPRALIHVFSPLG
jgi:hypothetical protein